MNKRIYVTSVMALLGALCFVAWMARARPATETITGKVVDLYCYDPKTGVNSGIDHTAAGPSHQAGKECAWACAKWEGQPVGLLTSDGKLYQLAGGVVADNNAKIAPHITHTVSITGEAAENAGIPTLTASDVKMISK